MAEALANIEFVRVEPGSDDDKPVSTRLRKRERLASRFNYCGIMVNNGINVWYLCKQLSAVSRSVILDT